MKLSPEDYCAHYCLYKGTLNCDIKLRCCPMWNYLNHDKPTKP